MERIKTFDIDIDYDKSIEELIREVPGYIDEHINSHLFPSTEKGLQQMSLKLLHLSQGSPISSSNEILLAMNHEGFRPGTLKELLSLHNQENQNLADLDRANSSMLEIVALGSTWDGRGWTNGRGDEVPTIWGCRNSFDLRLRNRRICNVWNDTSWSKIYFLAV